MGLRFLTMASTLTDPNNTFPRSISSSNIPDLLSLDPQKRTVSGESELLPRSASYTTLPSLDAESFSSFNAFEELSGSEEAAERLQERLKLGTGVLQTTSAAAEPIPAVEHITRRRSLVARPKSWLQRTKSSPERKTPPVPTIIAVSPVEVQQDSSKKTKKLSESFASFAKNSWMSASRSPSPNSRTVKNDDSSLNEDDSTAASSISSSSPRKSLSILPTLQRGADKLSGLTPKTEGRKRSSTLLKRERSPLEDPISLGGLESARSSKTNLPKLSLEKPVTPRGSSDVPPMPKSSTREKLAGVGADSNRRKDELWSPFRSLDGDFSKFHSKSSALKTNVVRATLLPFLRNYAQDPSAKNLRPEDVDRRTTILNKWWTGLLEMLDGSNSHNITGVDRPVLLEAVTGIMIRPEWRLAPSYFAPLADRAPNTPLPRSRSTNSGQSSSSQFLAESVYHNVRNMFIQNLLSQMRMVVEKMGLRNAPASLVSFCGKAAAYAFFFCPGVAEVLVKIWNIPILTIRQVADEFGLPRQFSGNLEDVVSEFPPDLRRFGFSITKALSQSLLQKVNLPLGASKINWHGPWVARWCGRDSDLFFVFCKYFHVLTEEFCPPELPLIQRARTPGFILVHAQLLTAMEATIHRQPSADVANGPAAVNVDEVLSGVDGSAAALPLPPASNVSRMMAENRLVMLLRDFVMESSARSETLRNAFVESFGYIMRAAAKKTSQFDHNACFILCDFMEEALSIYMRLGSDSVEETDFIDWQFWLVVTKKMLNSQNSMTEIRLFSLIYSSWNSLVADEKRKEILCLDWILSDDMFRTYFMHWCPMVRAYYMRMLCWRICRFEGNSSDLDGKILSAVLNRLKSVWSIYLYEKQISEAERRIPTSTAPCFPAPGRRLLIIRNDILSPSASLFLGFDGIVQTATSQRIPLKRFSSLAGSTTSNSSDFNFQAEASPNSKKRWSLLGKIMPFSVPDGSTPQQINHESFQKLEQARLATASERSKRPSMHRHRSSSSSLSSDSPSAPSTPTHRPFSFKFSLEWIPNHHNPAQNQNNNSLAPGQNRRLSPPRLPAPAHNWLASQDPSILSEVTAKKFTHPGAKYAGRALAEWTLIVMECNNFVERRKSEGVPSLKLVEVPTLGVEGFRRFG